MSRKRRVDFNEAMDVLRASRSPSAPTRRGTTNGNARGNTRDREARRRWLLKTWASDLWPTSRCRCYRCGEPLALDEITVDRIIPGAKGGTYRRNNIRPACARCNSETGGAVRG